MRNLDPIPVAAVAIAAVATVVGIADLIPDGEAGLLVGVGVVLAVLGLRQ